MSLILAAYDDAGAPLAGLTPSWIIVVEAGSGTPISPQPTFTDLGGGLYLIGSALTGSAAGIVDLGATAAPRYVHVDSATHSSVAAYSLAGVPLAGLTPTWSSIVDDTGSPVAGPTITDLGSGLYRINYTGPDARTGVLDFGATAAPRYYQWTFDPFDADPPVIANMVPAPGAITRWDAVDFDVTDVDPGLLRVILLLKYANRAETIVVHDGAEFKPPFDGADNLRTAITDGYHYTLLPAGGWTSDFDLEVVAIDSDGNQTA